MQRNCLSSLNNKCLWFWGQQIVLVLIHIERWSFWKPEDEGHAWNSSKTEARQLEKRGAETKKPDTYEPGINRFISLGEQSRVVTE